MRGLRLSLALVMVLITSTSGHAATFWEETFETAGAGNRFGLSDGSGVVHLSTAQHYAGAKSAYYYFDFPSAGSCLPGHPLFIDCGGYYDATFTPTGTLWRRFWILVMPGFTVASPTTKLTKAGSSSWSDWLVIGGNQTTTETVFQLNMDPQSTTPRLWGGVLRHDGVWQCIEIQQTVNTPGVANGTYALYLDGTQVANNTTTVWRPAGDTSNFSFVRLYRQYGSGQMYFDNYAVGDSRIGCGTAPPPPTDTLPPSMPTNAAVSASGTIETITWTLGADNTGGSGMAGTVVLNCTGVACTPTNTVTTVNSPTASYVASGLTAGTTYGWALRSQDHAGNLSVATTPVYATTGTVYRQTLFSDTFTRADAANAGSAYTHGHGSFEPCRILSNLITITTVNIECMETWSTAIANDQWARAALNVHSTTNPSYYSDAAVQLRWTDSAAPDGYVCIAEIGGGATTFFAKYTAGVYATIASNSVHTWVPGVESIDCEIQGTTYTVFAYNDATGARTLVLTGTDATFASGKTGLYQIVETGLTSLNVKISRFTTGDFSGSPPAPPTITTFQTSATGFTETDANTPYSYKLVYGSNDGLTISTLFLQTTDIVAGAYTITWPQSTQYACLYAIDEAGVVNTSADSYVCDAVTPGAVDSGPATGVLRQLGSTPWLTNDSGNGILLTGISGYYNGTWPTGILYPNPAFAVLQDIVSGATPAVNDWQTAIDTVAATGLNMVRTWIFGETIAGSDADFAAGDESHIPIAQMPYQQVGSRTDSSSGYSFTVGIYDLTVFNQSFFDRVRERILYMVNHGITPSIMLVVHDTAMYEHAGFSDPYLAANNVNGINGDVDADGIVGDDTHTLLSGVNGARILAFQKAYIHKLIDTLNDIDSIIWEICNECLGSLLSAQPNTTWVNAMADEIALYESQGGRKVHPIWLTPYAYNTNADQEASTQYEAIAPFCDQALGINYYTNPPVNPGTKIYIYDSDHAGLGGQCLSVTNLIPWQMFTRGYHFLYLDTRDPADDETAVKAAMAQTLSYANRMSLKDLLPVTNTTIIGTGYGLKNDCVEYLSFRGTDGSHTVDLSGCSAGLTFSSEYLDVTTGSITSASTVAGGASRSFNPAGSNPSVVYLKLLPSPTDVTPPTIFGCTINNLTTGGVLPIDTTSATLQCFSNESATVRFGTAAGIPYASQPNSMTAGTFDGVQQSHTATISGLTNGVSVTDYVRGIDASGNASSSDTTMAWSVGGQPDMTAPILSNPQPTTELPVGTTSTTISATANEAAVCYWSLTNQSYALMSAVSANVMASGGTLTHSATVGSLTNGSTTPVYARCTDLAEPTANVMTTSAVWSVVVASSTADTTAPSTVTNLTAALTDLQATLTWTVATDAGGVAGYWVYICRVDDCSDAILAQQLGNVTATILGLQYNTTYYFAVKAIDSSNNLSAALSNIATVTTASRTDTELPSTMANLRLITAYTRSAVLTSDYGTDNSGAVTTTLELSPAGCGAYVFIYSNLSLEALVTNLAPNTTYCVRGKFSDGTNTSASYSNVVTFTTASSGLDRQRQGLRFGVPRLPASTRVPRN